MLGFLTRVLGKRAGDPAAVAADLKGERTQPAPVAAAPVHVLLDKGLVRLVDGHLAFAAQGASDKLIRLDEVSQLSLFGEAGVTSPCLRELMRRGIPIVWRSMGGYYVGQTADLSGRSASARRAQYRTADDPDRALAIARSFVHAKIINERGLLRRNSARDKAPLEELRRLAAKAERVSSLPELLGVEGAAAAAFFAALPEMIAAARRSEFPWDGRRRRPPTDPMNALLSYLYAVVAGECATAALAAGLDPAVGFLHAERPGRPALALDLLEPFRPVIADAVALAVINRGEARSEHFEHAGASVRLNDGGRRVVLAALERRWTDAVPTRVALEAPMNWREAVAAQARSLVAALKSGEPFASFERG